MPVLDPDAIARELDPADPSRAAIQAGRRILSQWRSLIEHGTSFAIETTLAGSGPLDRIRDAKALGYRVRIYYVAIDTQELNVERVRRRVLQGGHGIPQSDIRRRYERSLRNAPFALSLADRASLLDNTLRHTSTVAEIESGKVLWQASDIPIWAGRILRYLRQASADIDDLPD